MCDGKPPEHRLLRETVELHTLLQTIASVEESVWVSGTEPGQTGGQQSILTLHQRTGTELFLNFTQVHVDHGINLA